MKKFNIFTFLAAAAVFSFFLQLADFSARLIPPSAAESAAPAKEAPAAEGGAEKKEEAPAQKDGAADKEAAVKKDEAAAPPAYGERGFSSAELDVLQSLAKRRDDLDKREQQIGQREALLKAAEGEVDRKITELNKIKGELEALLNKQQAAQDNRIGSLVKIYEGMKPKEAARIFDTLDMEILVSVIGKMSERKSSPILANMDPDKARLVTIELTEQNKLPSGGEKEQKIQPEAAPRAPAPAAAAMP